MVQRVGVLFPSERLHRQPVRSHTMDYGHLRQSEAERCEALQVQTVDAVYDCAAHLVLLRLNMLWRIMIACRACDDLTYGS